MGPDELIQLCTIAGTKYKPVLIPKKDGSTRHAWNAHNDLKSVQARIQCLVLKKVIMPEYLHGSLKGRDSLSNAKAHVGCKILIKEDIKDFFPSITAEVVFKIWTDICKFPPIVACALTWLTTKNGYVPQGAKTSSYLANMALYKVEPSLVEELEKRGITYTRYVDDITLSSKRFVVEKEQIRLIALICRSLGVSGFKPKRRKHETNTSAWAMPVTGLLVNQKPSLPPKQRSAIRSQVEYLEGEALDFQATAVYKKRFNSVSGKVAAVQRHHPHQGQQLRQRLKKLAPISNE